MGLDSGKAPGWELFFEHAAVSTVLGSCDWVHSTVPRVQSEAETHRLANPRTNIRGFDAGLKACSTHEW